MTLKEFYSKIGGDYDGVTTRMCGEKLVLKYALKFLDDTTFAALGEALEKGDCDSAFRAAHTVKGVCLNLSFDGLLKSIVPLTEVLRGGSLDVGELYEKAKADYGAVISALKELKESV